MATVTSDPSATVSASSLVINKVWVKNPYNPAKNATAYHADKVMGITKKRSRQTVELLGRDLPVVISGTAKSDAFSLKFLCEGDAQYDGILAALDTTDTLLVQTPKRQWYVQLSGDMDLQEDEWSLGQSTIRTLTVPVQQVDVP